jgi:hypothetical protein
MMTARDDRLAGLTPPEAVLEIIRNFRTGAKSALLIRLSRPIRGALAIVTNVGRDAVDADAPITNGVEAYGEDVWS